MDGRAAAFFVALQIAYLTFAGLPPIAKPWVDATNFVYGIVLIAFAARLIWRLAQSAGRDAGLQPLQAAGVAA